MAEQYLTLAGKTDAAFRALVEYLRVFDEPTIVIMFGDHQPSVEQASSIWPTASPRSR